MTTIVKKKRLRPKRGLGAQYTRARKNAADLAKQMAEDRKKKERDAARRDLDRRKATEAKWEKETDDKFRMSMLRQVQSTQTAVLRAWGYSIPVQASLSTQPNVVAYTDFRRIVVNWPKASMPGMNSSKRAVTRCLISMRGVFQHEAGHVRFTTPWHFIRDATQFKKYKPEGDDRYSRNQDDQRLARVNNVLEDQRMENLVVEVVPKIADYFGTMILDVIIDGGGKQDEGGMNIDLSWLLLAGRRYLDPNLRMQSMNQFEASLQGLGFDPGTAQHWADIVDEYIAAKTKSQLGIATEKALVFLDEIGQEIPSSVDDHAAGGMDNAGIFLPNGDDDDGDARASGGSRGGSATDGMDPAGAAKAKQGKLDGDALKKAMQDAQDAMVGGGAGKGEGGYTFADQLRTARDGAIQKVEESKDLKQIVGDAMDGAAYDGLPEYEGPVRELDAESIDRANTIAAGLVQMLQSFVTAHEPTWQFRVEEGYIDPLAYRTKEPGERNFRRYMEDQGKQALDVHLSILADCSGSMGHNMQALSEVLYGCAIATEQVSIGSTYVLWSSGDQNFRVWGTTDPQPDLFPSMGGTTPDAALDDLVNHNPEGAAHHLVVIFTDGAWYGNYNLQQWSDPNKTIVLVRYGNYEGEFQGDLGADEHVQISDVLDLADHVSIALTDVLSSLGGGADGWG